MVDRDSYALNAALDRLEAENEFERAAAIALFNLKIRRAIQALNKGSVTARTQGRVAFFVVMFYVLMFRYALKSGATLGNLIENVSFSSPWFIDLITALPGFHRLKEEVPNSRTVVSGLLFNQATGIFT